MASIPATSMLSEFLGANEDPLSESGAWAQLTPARAPLKLSGNTATDSIHGNPAYSYWTKNTFVDSTMLEVWACSVGGQLGAALETWRLAMWSTVGAGVRGYLCYFGGSTNKEYTIRRYDGSIDTFTNIATTLVGSAYPQKMLFRRYGNTLEFWTQVNPDPAFHLRLSATDGNYHGKFWLSLSIEDPTGGGLGFSCFGGGRTHRTQIYRVLRSI